MNAVKATAGGWDTGSSTCLAFPFHSHTSSARREGSGYHLHEHRRLTAEEKRTQQIYHLNANYWNSKCMTLSSLLGLKNPALDFLGFSFCAMVVH